MCEPLVICSCIIFENIHVRSILRTMSSPLKAWWWLKQYQMSFYKKVTSPLVVDNTCMSCDSLVQTSLCLSRSRSRSGPSISPHSWRCSRSYRHRSRRWRPSSPFCDWSRRPGPVGVSASFLHSIPADKKSVPTRLPIRLVAKKVGPNQHCAVQVGDCIGSCNYLIQI